MSDNPMPRATAMQLASSAERSHFTSLGQLLRALIHGAVPMTFMEPVTPPAHTVANAPDAADYPGSVIYVSNGAAGDPILAFSDGTNWLRSDTQAAITSAP